MYFFKKKTKNKFMKNYFIFLLSLVFFLMCLLGNFYGYAYLSNGENDEREFVNVLILMYHSVLKSVQGQYTVSPTMLENDIKYLQERGYTAVFIKDLINYCNGDADLPEKPVVLSFDDGHYNNFFYAYPLIEKYNFKANLNIVGGYCDYSTTSGDIDNPNYSYLTWKEIKTLHDSGYFEIGNHTFKMHSFKPRFGISKIYGESDEDYKKALSHDIKKLEDKFESECGFNCEVFAYPFGKYSSQSQEILQELGFKAFLTCNEGINKLYKGQSKELLHLKRINRSGLLSTWQFFERYKIY